MLEPPPVLRTLARLPRLGFGVSGAHGFGLTPRRVTESLVTEAYRLGIRVFDSAPFYGDAEARLGAALQAVGAKDALVVSKLGTIRSGGRPRKDFTPSGLRSQLQQALDNLRRNHIEVLLLHGPPGDPLPEETLDTLRDFRARGQVGALGVAGRQQEVAVTAENPLFEVVQAPVWSHWPAWCAARGKAVLGIEALARLDEQRSWLVRDPAGAWLVARRVKRWLDGAPAVQAPAGAAQEVLRAALQRPGVSTVLMTTTRLAHLRSNCALLQDGAP